MLRLPEFEYISPKTVTEAVAIKQKYGAQAMYVAGGTDLFPKMKRRQLEPRLLIGLNEIESLRTIANGNGVTLGAMVTLTEVVQSSLINRKYPALAKAAGLVSSPQLRNAGTIGGNLCVDTRCTYYDQTYPWRQALGFCMKKDGDICWVAKSSPKCLAVSSSDTAPVAIALGATVKLVGPDGERTVPVEALYQNDGQFYLAKSPDEILMSIYLPDQHNLQMTYWKLRRRGTIDFPILGVAVALQLKADRVCTHCKIVLGAVASQPVVLGEDVTNMLLGQKVTPALIDEVAALAYRPAKPLDNTDMGLAYRKKMAKVYIRGALLEAAGLANEL